MAAPLPYLFVDIDGVISLFGFDPASAPKGTYHVVDGIVHLLSATAGQHLRRLSDRFELVWCSGWEEKANEHLPKMLGIEPLPHVALDHAPGSGHWKLAPIERYAGDRPLAWIDDALDDRCLAWADLRPAPTLLLECDPEVGITHDTVVALLAWADRLGRGVQGPLEQ